MSNYLRRFGSQIPVIGNRGQKRLSRPWIHVSSQGRVGTTITFGLAASGFLHISANDGQTLTEDNMGAFVFARNPDLRQWKVFVTQHHLDGLPGLVYEPIVALNESPEVDEAYQRAELIVCASNRPKGRAACAAKAIKYGKPLFNVSVADGRERLRGFIHWHLPECPGSACFACLLNAKKKIVRGEGLLFPVIAGTAALAVNLIVQYVVGMNMEFLRTRNLVVIDFDNYHMEALSVKRRESCNICAPRPDGPGKETS